MAVTPLIFWRNESEPILNKLDQEIVSGINRALSHQQAPAHIKLIPARRKGKSTITAITHQNRTEQMDIQCQDNNMTGVGNLEERLLDVQEHETWDSLKIHEVPLVHYMGKGTEGLQKRREEFEAENKGVAIPTQVE
jgi:hypothetical protein